MGNISILRRILNAILSFFGTLIGALFFCYFLPRSVFKLESDLNLFAFKISDFDLITFALAIIGLVFIILGIFFLIGAIWGFLLRGNGSPVPGHFPDELVSRGAYQFVRNPIYFGCCLILFGQAFLYKSFGYLFYLFGYFLIWHICVVLSFEEPMLKDQYGKSYEHYCNSVPRWIPRLRLLKISSSKSSNHANSVDS